MTLETMDSTGIYTCLNADRGLGHNKVLQNVQQIN